MRFTRITVAPPGNTVVQPGAAGAPLTVMQRRRGTTIVLTSATTGPRGDVTPALQQLVDEAEQWADAAAASAAEAASLSVEINVVATPDVLAAKEIALPAAPRDPLTVQLTVYGGPPQRAGVDFVVVDNILSWASLALELLLEAGNVFVVRFIKRVN